MTRNIRLYLFGHFYLQRKPFLVIEDIEGTITKVQKVLLNVCHHELGLNFSVILNEVI